MKHWPKKQLGELLKVQNGFAFKSELFNDQCKGLPLIRIRDLARGFSKTFYNGEHDSEFEVKNGDFLIGMDGEFRCYRWKGGKALLNQRVCRLHNFNPELSASYVFYGINAHLRIIEDTTAFVTVKHLSSKQIASIEMPVPPLAEQERIVKLLCEADDLRKLRNQSDSRSEALIPALFFEMFGDPLKNTSRSPILPLAEVVDFGSGATPSKDNPTFWNGRTPWVSPKDMKPEEITDAEDHVSAAAFEESNLNLFPKDTVLIVVRGMILAHTVPIRLCRVPAAINQDMKALLPKIPIEPEFLRWSLQTQHAKLLNHVSTAGHGTKKLDSDRLREVTIPIPPLALQREFVQRVAVIRELAAIQAISRSRLEALFQSLLHCAFNDVMILSNNNKV